jgi:two-component system, OmpR family, alkaline phosphatase synthesis response regulator PhoP
MPKATVLVIEDDPDIRELLAASLAPEGWRLLMAASGEEGLALLDSSEPDCVLLDIMLPGADGLEVLRRIKAGPTKKRVPVILASARGEESDVVAGLELGAEDYVVKPYSPKVLAARVRAALRRSAAMRESEGPGRAGAPGAALSKGAIRLDPGRHEAKVGERTVELSATEFAILEFLMRNPGWVFSRSRIIDAVKGPDYPVTDRAVDVQILSLRRKLGEASEEIETVRGVGYRLRD